MQQEILVEIGRKLRKIRKAKGLTVQTIASRAGVSKGLISRIENNHTIPSLPVLISIIKSLEVGLNVFFKDLNQDDLGDVIIKKAETLTDANAIQTGVLRFPILDRNVPEGAMKTNLLEIPHGEGHQVLATSGFAYHYIIKGNVLYQITEEDHQLAGGDSLCFDARRSYSVTNIGEVTAQILEVHFTTEE